MPGRTLAEQIIAYLSNYILREKNLNKKLARSDRMHFVDKTLITVAEWPSRKIFPIYFPTSTERVSPSFQWGSILGIIFLLHLVQS